MPYHLERFIDVYLPAGNPSSDLSPIPAKPAIVQTLSGPFDMDQGDDAVDDLPHTITYDALSDGDTADEWRLTEDALRALVGKRGWLWRRSEDEAQELQRAICKLMSNGGPRSTQDKMWKMDSFSWLQLDHWRGHYHIDWALDDGHFLDDELYLDDDATYTVTTAPQTITLTNDGNARVTDAIITITAGGVSITDVSIVKTGESDLQFTGVITAHHSLVIDCGAYSVLNNGVDAYTDFELDTDHAINEWLRLDPGANEIIITLTVINFSVPPTVTINFMDSWK